MTAMMEEITGLNVYGQVTGLPGTVTLKLGIDGKEVQSGGDHVTEVTFGIDDLRRLHIMVTKGAQLWSLDGQVLLPGKLAFMRHHNTCFESRALFNDRVLFRWRAYFDNDRKLQLLVEQPTSVSSSV